MTALDKPEKSLFFPDEFNWWQLDQDCPTCTLPLHIASGQGVPFCPNCAIDIRNAKNGREALTVAKARDLRRRLAVGDEPSGAFTTGLPV